MARWESALESQVRLLRWWRSDKGVRYARGFADDIRAAGRGGYDMYRAMPQIEGMKLERGEPVFVNDAVMDLLDAAANHETFKFEPFLAEDLFCPEGFALLPRPFYVMDANGKRCSVRAFSWGPVLIADESRREATDPEVGRVAGREGFEQIKDKLLNAGLHVTLYAHWDDDDDYNVEWRGEVAAEMAQLGLGPHEGYRYLWGGDLSMFHATVFAWGQMPEEDGYRRTNLMSEEEVRDHDWQSLWRYIQTFFRLADQRIAIRDRVHGDRKERRRLARIKPDNDGVLVVRLRRPKTPRTSDQYEVDWQRQWIVGGHWRQQWYPSLGKHQMIWIAPYVKGPEDKPLVLHSGRAFEFVR